MKTLFIGTLLTAIVSSGMLTSCSANKRMQASKNPVKTTKTDSIEVIRETRKTPGTTKTVEKETTVAMPPSQIENKFSGEHSLATNISWAKETANTSESSKANYKAAYIEDGKKNWVTYNESGTVVEERHEILTDQLPQNIYNSIKAKYPDAKITSATTYKHLKQDGSYAVIVKPFSGIAQKETELIVREDGTFVQ